MILSLYIQPSAKETKFDGVFNEHHKLRVKAPPVDGKANKEIIRFLSEYFKVKKSDIKILSGVTGRYKRVEIFGVEENQISF